MSYDYYCLNCGKTQRQETVLFDMHRLLIEDENSDFNVMRLRLTQDELKELIASGPRGEDGYHTCTLTLSQIMGYISNSNNMNNPVIATLTMDEINNHAAAQSVSAGASVQTSSDLVDEDDDLDDVYEEEESQAEEKESPAIKALMETKLHAQVGDIMAGDLVNSDLDYLSQAFQNGDYTVKIKPQMEPYGENQELLIGFVITYPVSRKNYSVLCRVCPDCGEPIFKEAGTAKHRSVVFIGNPSSGKTSTILALTHYAENYMVYGLSSEIWGHSRRIGNVNTIRLLAEREELKKHKDQYYDGIAPERTPEDDRKKAYSATFHIQCGNKTTLLTLTDLPGEICNKEGRNEVDENAVRNAFQVALGCDAYVVCFDTEAVQTDSGKQSDMTPGEIVNSICDQANTFQRLRSERYGKDFIPTMLLFTKCRELEKENKDNANNTAVYRPMERVYMFRDEKRIINGNGIYQAVCNAFNDTRQLSRAYHAMLRCSPFGYGAPTKSDVEKGEGNPPQTPTPKHIDRLMHWVLMITGCVPVEAEYCINPDGTGARIDSNGYYLNRVQCRSERPGDDWDLHEALARFGLFENPGYIDQKVLENFGQHRTVTAVSKFVNRSKPNIYNDRR